MLKFHHFLRVLFYYVTDIILQLCMDRLGIETIADLLGRNELELVSQKNFGVTSLNEVKRKLTERGLNLTTG